MSAVHALREYSARRVGELLPAASKVFSAAERERRESIDGAYVDEILDSAGGGLPDADDGDGFGPLMDDTEDDLLA